MAKNTYNYKTITWETIGVTLDDALMWEVRQAEADYNTAASFVVAQCYYIWKYAYKSYHLSTLDRQNHIKNWQSNIHSWFIRGFIDVFASALSEKPLAFMASAFDEEWLRNKDDVVHTLSANADKSKFHIEAKKWLLEGLKTGTFAFRVAYKRNGAKMDIITLVDWIPVEKTIETEPANYPYAYHLDVFSAFPDPQNSGRMRYMTERQVTSLAEFTETWWDLINNKENKSPLKSIDFIKLLANNQNWADLNNYWDIREQIYQKINEQLQNSDTYDKVFTSGLSLFNTNPSQQTANEDTRVTKWMIEWKFYTRDDTIVLVANNYPVYIGKNVYGFIPYVIRPATSSKVRLGCEGIPYLLRWFEEAVNSFVNNYVDSARAVATPSFSVMKWLLTNESQLESAAPGSTIYIEPSQYGHNVINRIDKGTASDLWIIQVMTQLAQTLVGASDYNMGVSAKERTASGANALTTSADRRMSPYVSNFIEVLVEIGEMWLRMMRRRWVKENFVSILDSDSGERVNKYIKNTNLTGWISLSLSPDGLFTNFNDMRFKRLLEFYTQVAQSNIVDAPYIISELSKLSGLAPEKTIVDYGKKTPDAVGIGKTTPSDMPASQEAWIDLAAAANPQLDLGNGWQWAA